MGTPTWPKLPDLIEDLLADGSQYGFFQALRLIEQLWADRGVLGEDLDRWLRLRPAQELAFPAADLRSCHLQPASGRLELQVNAFGLYGVDAPVPHYILDRATADGPGAQTLRDFLDLFSHRLYVLFYRAWQLGFEPGEATRSPYRSAMASMSGGRRSTAEPQGTVIAGSDLEHAAAFGRRVRSAAGLADVLSESLAGAPVRVLDCLPQWVKVEASFLGRDDLPLGQGALLGQRARVAGGRVVIEIGPIDYSTAQDLQPAQPRGRALLSSVRRYLAARAEFDLVLRVRAEASVGQRLGSDGLRLGWSTWVGDRCSSEYRIRINGDTAGEQDAAPLPKAA